MPKRNYGFEKRQKELAKIRKRQEKAERRADRSSAPDEQIDQPSVTPGPDPAE